MLFLFENSSSWGNIEFVSVYDSKSVLEGRERNFLSETKSKQTSETTNKKFNKIVFRTISIFHILFLLYYL